MKQFTKIIVTTFFIAFLASCSKDKDASPSSASVVGKWTISAFGIRTDVKAAEATIAEIKKLDPDAASDVEGSIEFKADGTYSADNGGTKETGKYVVDAGNKNITTTSAAAEVYSYEILSLSNSAMELVQFKTSKKDADGDFEFPTFEETLVFYLFAEVVYGIRGLNGEDELEKAKSAQLTIKFVK